MYVNAKSAINYTFIGFQDIGQHQSHQTTKFDSNFVKFTSKLGLKDLCSVYLQVHTCVYSLTVHIYRQMFTFNKLLSLKER